MTRTIVKTGCVLTLPQQDRCGFVRDILDMTEGHRDTLYGDLHVVGNCAVMYFPEQQTTWKKVHGRFIGIANPHYKFFARNAKPHCILVIPAEVIIMEYAALHENDRSAWQLAGGRLSYEGIAAS